LSSQSSKLFLGNAKNLNFIVHFVLLVALLFAAALCASAQYKEYYVLEEVGMENPSLSKGLANGIDALKKKQAENKAKKEAKKQAEPAKK
jgi:serine protease inhibitor ecotin